MRTWETAQACRHFHRAVHLVFPHARGFTRCRVAASHHTCLGLPLGFALSRSRPSVLIFLFRRTAPLQYARRRPVRNPLDSSSAAITAASVAEFSAGSTRPGRCVSMSWLGSIPTANCIVRANVATVPSASGSIFVQAAPTARAPAAAQRLSRHQLLLCLPSDLRTPASAASPRASRAPGTGAPSELVVR